MNHDLMPGGVSLRTDRQAVFFTVVSPFSLTEPTSFLDHLHLGCTQRECQISYDIVANSRDMFEPRISVAAKEMRPIRGKPDAETISSWSCDLKGYAKKRVERCCEFAKNSTHQFFKFVTPCIDDHQLNEENESVGELSAGCSQIVLKCLYLARIGRPDFLWSVNTLARSITKWTKACDKRLNRLISYIHHTYDYKQNCYAGNTAKQCTSGYGGDWSLSVDGACIIAFSAQCTGL